MSIITVTGNGQISYSILKDYHFSAEAIHKIRAKQSLSMEEEWSYEIDIEAESTQEARDIFLTYIKKLNELGVANHTGHLIYITQSINKFEGNYINDEAVLNDLVSNDLVTLGKLLKMQDNAKYDLLNLEFTSKQGYSNSEFEEYSKINHPEVIRNVIAASIDSLFNLIKSNAPSYPILVAARLKCIDKPNIDDIQQIIEQTSAVKRSKFETELLYTVCATLHSYLNDWSPLNPNGAHLTNDQIRVIYQTCKMHGLLKVTHDVELDALNYIRMLLKNNSGNKTMLGIIKDHSSSD